jgi:hypothetical protein
MATTVPIPCSPATPCFSLESNSLWPNFNYLRDLLWLGKFSTMSEGEQRKVVHQIQSLGSMMGKEASSLVDDLLKKYFSKLLPEEVSWALEYNLSPDTLIFLLRNQLSLDQYTQIADRLIETKDPSYMLQLLDLDLCSFQWESDAPCNVVASEGTMQVLHHLSSGQRMRAADVVRESKYQGYLEELSLHLTVFLCDKKLTPEKHIKAKDCVIELGIVNHIQTLLEDDPLLQLDPVQHNKAVNRLIEIGDHDLLVPLWDRGQICPLKCVQLTDEQSTILKPKVTEIAIWCLSKYNSVYNGTLTEEEIRTSVEKAVLEHGVNRFLSEQWKQIVDNMKKRMDEFFAQLTNEQERFSCTRMV